MKGDFLNRLLDRQHISGRDFSLFLLSVLLAFSIWLIYNLSLNYTDIVSMPVVAHSNIDGHSQVSSNSSVVVARCSATGFDLMGLKRYSRHHIKDVFFAPGDFHPGGKSEEFNITIDELNAYVKDIFGDNVHLESFISRNVQFRFPLENHKRVPVQSVQNLSYRPQYTSTGNMKIQPDSVTIYGEPYHLQNIDRVFTSAINLTDLHSSVHGVIPIEPINGVRISEREANYSLAVTRFVEITSTVNVIARGVPPGKHLSIYPSTAQVIYHCSFPVTEDPSDDVVLYIDYDDFTKSINGRCVAKASGIPAGVIDYQIVPQIFECIERNR